MIIYIWRAIRYYWQLQPHVSATTASKHMNLTQLTFSQHQDKIASTSEEDRSKNGIVDVDVEILLMVKKNIRGQMYHIYIQKQIISN